MKLIGWVLALVIIAAAAGGAYYYFVMMKAPAPAAPAAPVGDGTPQGGLMPGGEVRPGETQPTLVGTQGVPDESSFVWTFASVGTDAAPRTTVTFHYNLGEKKLGTFDGSCTRLRDSAWAALPGEVDGVICYFAGFGTELAIFKEGAIYVAKKGELQEGSEETGSVRGNFEVIEAL